ncbi:uncharacterized protein [Cherax quadricarinatus]|uniref:uncharacterized protein isoform X2 n=1 Tax=Cherax quadricarinatus TaxID=27406 RepID=UPI00387EB2A0
MLYKLLWILWVFYLYLPVAVHTAHLPADATNTSANIITAASQVISEDEDVQTSIDIDDLMGQTENKPLGVLKQLMNPTSKTKGIFNIKSEGSKVSSSPDGAGTQPVKEIKGNSLKQSNSYGDEGGSRVVFSSAGIGPSVPVETYDPLKSQNSAGDKAGSSSRQGPRRESFLVTHGSLLDTSSTHPPPPLPQLNHVFRMSPGREEQQQQPQKQREMVSKQELILLFSNSGRGINTLSSGCSVQHVNIKSRCSANVLELSASSRVPVLCKISLVEGEGEVLMDGAYMVGDSTCMVEVTCQNKGGARVINFTPQAIDRSQESIFPTTPTLVTAPSATFNQVSVQDATSTAKTTLSLLHGSDPSGSLVTGVVDLGTKMVLVVSVYCKDITLDLHMVKCQAKGEDGLAVSLVKDGCSVSQVMGEFREVLGIVHESSFGATPVRRVTQYAQIEAFNTRPSQQNITIICTIKMCSEVCLEQPACVHSDINLGRSKRPTISQYSQMVTLGKAFRVAGLSGSSSEGPSKILRGGASPKDAVIYDTTALSTKCMPYKSVYILVGMLSGMYLIILGVCVYCVHRSATRTVVQSCLEDYESPKKALYPEYSSPRKRSPKGSPEYSSLL